MVKFLNGEEKCRQKTSSFVKKLGGKCRWMRGKNSGVMKREVRTACLSLKRGLTPQQQQKIRFQTFSPRKKRRCSKSIASVFFFLCVWVLSKWRCSAAYHYRPLFNGCEKCAYMGILKPHSRLLRSFIFFFFWSYSSMPFPIFFDPNCGRNNSSKKNLRVPNASKKGHSKHAIGWGF